MALNKEYFKPLAHGRSILELIKRVGPIFYGEQPRMAYDKIPLKFNNAEKVYPSAVAP